MSDEFLDDRRRSLEEQFFARENQKLIERLRQQQEHEQRTRALQAASGIADDALLERLVELGLGADTVAALSLLPLVEVAWADGDVKEAERRAVLDAAHESGIEKGSAPHELLESWLRRRPDAALLASWKEYASLLSAELGEDARDTLRAGIIGRAEKVALAAGGFLGAGAISGKEQDKLWELERAFK